jgi:excisionase family DNA binding protein
MTGKLLSAQQVADYLGMHVKTLYKLLRENKIALSYVRVHGRMIAFRPAAVELYVSTHEVERTGSGVEKKAGRKKPKFVREMIMTDEEAQVFFQGVERLPDGTLACSPESEA